MNHAATGRRSPLKHPPRRQAGQKLFEDLHVEYFSLWVFLIGGSVFLVLFAAIEWGRWFWAWRPQPLLWTVVALGFGGYAAWRIIRDWGRARNVALGMHGERAVDEALAPLAAQGYRVFHDLPGRRGNIDHVIVGPSGVFALETKARRKPDRGPTVIRYDGKSVRINGGPPADDGLAQARAVAAEVAEHLHDATGRRVLVRPVLCFPGWFVEGEQDAEVWVLNADRIHKWVVKEEAIRGRMPDDEVSLLALRLTEWARRDS